MTDATPEWDEYIAYRHGLFRARISAEALRAYTQDVFDAATFQITAAAGEEEGVTLTVSVPPPVAFSKSIWFTTPDDGAEAFAAALAAASVTEERTWPNVQAWPDQDPLEPLMVVVATDPDQYAGVLVHILYRDAFPGAVLLSPPNAAAAAEAIRAAIAYLADHGAA
jgi:hypothetical protein